MKLSVEGTPKEIADLALAVQSQPKKGELPSPKNVFAESFNEILQRNIHDTSGEKPDLN